MKFRRNKPQAIATVAFNMRPARGPWGGSSTFVDQFSAYLQYRGYRVTYALRGRVDAIVLIDPRDDLENKTFGMDEIRAYKGQHPGCCVLHRVNECDLRKHSDFMDAALAAASPVADHTVFISQWLADYHAERWFDTSRPHSVIYNGADPRIFHPFGASRYRQGETLRIVTHHWADSRIKGFDVYEALDGLLAEGSVRDVQLVVCGRWPADITWRVAETHAPCHGATLARLLRSCHVYLTASKHEPCGMHHVEGAQCGLPLLYHEDGGGINEAGQRYGIGFRDHVGDAIETMRANYEAMRNKVLTEFPSGDRMCLDYANTLQRMLAC